MRTCCAKLAALLLGLSFFPIWNGAFAQNIIYVDQSASGVDDGSSWTNAYIHLQDALQAANGDVEIWVASGTYRPDQGASATLGDREAAFYIPGGVSIFGGFAGDELARDDRDWKTNETILSGDLLGNDDEFLSFDNPLRQDNSYHVVRIDNVTEPVVVDGFTIADGMAVGISLSRGSAIWINSKDVPNPVRLVRISNCRIEQNLADSATVLVNVSPVVEEPSVIFEKSTVRNNRGGIAGISIWSGTTVIQDVVFEENTGGDAGAVHNTHSHENVYVIGCVISNNIGTTQVYFTVDDAETDKKSLFMWDTQIVGNSSRRAAVYVRHANLLSVNNIFNGNSAESYASAIFLSHSEARIVNNVFAFNSIDNRDGRVIFLWQSNASISNSIFWENPLPGGVEFFSSSPVSDNHIWLNHSIIQEELPSFVTDEGGLLYGDPFFVDADGPDGFSGTIDDDFRLASLSRAIDAGDDASLPLDAFDVDGDGRLVPFSAPFVG